MDGIGMGEGPYRRIADMEISDPRIDPSLVPEGSRAKVVNGPNNEYRDLPSVWTPNGYCITRWTPSEEERIAILRGEDIYVTLVTAGKINPMFVSIGPVDWKASE